MTRLTPLLTALALAGLFTGATIIACGGRTAPPEMPPLAPRPDPVGPAIPLPGAQEPTSDAGTPQSPGPVTMRPGLEYGAAFYQPAAATADGGVPSRATDGGVSSRAVDAGVPGPSDAAPVPLPPIPDSSIPADSRMEPILQRDAGR